MESGGGYPPPKRCSVLKTTRHSGAECLKQRAQRQAQAHFANLESASLAHDNDSGAPTFGFSYATVGGSAAATAAAAPSAFAETAIPLDSPTFAFFTPRSGGMRLRPKRPRCHRRLRRLSSNSAPPVSERLENQRDSTSGLFGAFGETSTAFAASSPGDGYQITMMVDSGASGHLFDPFLIPGLRGLMRDYCSPTVSYQIVTAGQ